jgi:hypothetical protein
MMRVKCFIAPTSTPAFGWRRFLPYKRDAEFTFGSPHFLYSYYREPGSLKETVDLMAAEFPSFSKFPPAAERAATM